MPAEIVTDLISIIFRFLINVFVEVVLGFLIQGPGYLFCRIFNKSVQPDGGLSTIVGILFWILVGYLSYSIYQFLLIDSCLDSGGSCNYATSDCDR
jgi:hypothetical protein